MQNKPCVDKKPFERKEIHLYKHYFVFTEKCVIQPLSMINNCH